MTQDSQTITADEGLLPCPICGGDADYYENAIDFTPVWGASCRACNLVQDICADTKGEAAASWNYRPARAALNQGQG